MLFACRLIDEPAFGNIACGQHEPAITADADLFACGLIDKSKIIGEEENGNIACGQHRLRAKKSEGLSMHRHAHQCPH